MGAARSYAIPWQCRLAKVAAKVGELQAPVGDGGRLHQELNQFPL